MYLKNKYAGYTVELVVDPKHVDVMMDQMEKMIPGDVASYHYRIAQYRDRIASYCDMYHFGIFFVLYKALFRFSSPIGFFTE